MYNLFVNPFLAVTAVTGLAAVTAVTALPAVTAVMAAVVEGGQQFSTAEYNEEGTFIPKT